MSIPDAVTVREHDGTAPDGLDVEVLLHFANGVIVEIPLTTDQKGQLLALAHAEKCWPASVAVVTTRHTSGCGVMLLYDRRPDEDAP